MSSVGELIKRYEHYKMRIDSLSNDVVNTELCRLSPQEAVSAVLADVLERLRSLESGR